jgi:hypothetical protein
MNTYLHLWLYLAKFVLEWEMFQITVVKNQNTYFVFNNLFRKSCRLWGNVEKYVRARQATNDNIIRRMPFACWITKATDTHSEYVIVICFSTTTMVMRTRVNLMLCVHCLSCSFVLPFRTSPQSCREYCRLISSCYRFVVWWVVTSFSENRVKPWKQ